MDEYRFSKEDFTALCQHAKTGDIIEFKKIIEGVSNQDKSRFGIGTFCPDPSLRETSPFVVAAQHGVLKVVKFLLETYPHSIDINRGASITSKTQQIVTHNVPPLVAACTNDNIELVKYLLEHGADIHKQSLTRATPLRAAAYYGYIHIMECLLDNGADLNKANCIGSSPLLAAAHNGGAEATKFLIEKGCDLNQRTIEGYTAIHEASQKGEVSVVKVLLDYGISPEFAPSHPRQPEGYVPCPLYLAASMGRREVFDLLIAHPDCTRECKADAYLLLATSIFEYPEDDNDPEGEKSLELWEKGLELLGQLEDPVYTLPPIEEYGNHVEIRSQSEIKSLWNQPDFMEIGLPLQCLIIRERCMGQEDQSLIECLVKRGAMFLYLGYYGECEGLWRRAIKVEEKICDVECRHPEFGYCDGILKDLEGDLGDYVEGLRMMVATGYTPNFKIFFEFGLKCLEFLKRLEGKADSEVLDSRQLLLRLLELFRIWIRHDYIKQLKSEAGFVASTDCISLCKALISSYLNYSPRCNLLHDFLSEVSFYMEDMVSDEHLCSYSISLEKFLMCGAEKVINEPDGNGNRPISRVFELESEIAVQCMSILIDFGAHVDAVDHKGQMCLNWQTRHPPVHSYLMTLGPLKLACYAAQTIVREKIKYLQVGLPSHVISFVKMHDCRFALPERTGSASEQKDTSK